MTTPISIAQRFLTLEFLATPAFSEPFELDSHLQREDLTRPDLTENPIPDPNALLPYSSFLTNLLSKRWRKKPLYLLKSDHRLLEDASTETEQYQRFALSGLAQLIAGEADRAEECLLKAADINDDFPLHHYIYALYHGLHSTPEEAFFELHLAIERLPEPTQLTRIFAAQQAFADLVDA